MINNKVALLKNKYVHKGVVTAQQSTTQKKSPNEKPKINDEDFAENDNVALVEDQLIGDQKTESQPKHSLINLNPIQLT